MRALVFSSLPRKFEQKLNLKCILQVFHDDFYLQVPFSTPFSITFHVKLVGKVLSLNHQFVDSTGQVFITGNDVDPALFHRFLEFNYTGKLTLSFDNEELFVVADKYRVEI